MEVFLSLLALVLVSLSCGTAPESSVLPNYVILFADDMGYGDVAFNGHPTIDSPNLDKLAREGMILSTWYSGFSICSPSRASMLTGRLPMRTGCAGAWTGGVFPNSAIGGLPHSEITFAEALKEVGYTSQIIGKWHLGQRKEFLPFYQGFDHYYGIPYSVDMGASPWEPKQSGSVLPLIDNLTIIEQPVDLTTLSKRYAERAVQFIHESARNKIPFILYMAFNHVHTPDFVGEKFCNTSRRGRFGDGVTEMDDVVGAIMNALKDSDVDSDTLTFFTSDNGPWLPYGIAGGSAGLFRGGKHNTWEGGIRMPGLVRWPGRIEAGSRSAEIVATYDIFPTILSLSGVDLPNDRIIDGADMSDILFATNGGQSSHDCIYIYGGTPGAGNSLDGTPCNNDTDLCPGLFAIRCGSYKMHWVVKSDGSRPQFFDPPLLYNIDWDPSEQHPIWPNNVNYDSLLDYFEEKRAEHKKTVEWVENQILLGGNNDYWPCCDPNSQQKYPQYLNCTCNPQNWNQSTCDPQCYSTGGCNIYSLSFDVLYSKGQL